MTIDEIKARDDSSLPDGSFSRCSNSKGFYVLNRHSTLPPDDNEVLMPLSGNGRWILIHRTTIRTWDAGSKKNTSKAWYGAPGVKCQHGHNAMSTNGVEFVCEVCGSQVRK